MAQVSFMSCVVIPAPLNNIIFRIEVRLPRTWLSLVEQVAWNYDEETVDNVLDQAVKAATSAAVASVPDMEQALMLEESLRGDFDETMDIPEDSISVDLLSPIPSRNPSPRRLRPKSKSPARWKIVRSISDAIRDVMEERNPGMYSRCHMLRLRDLLLKFRHSSRAKRSPSRSLRPTSRF